MVRVKSTRPVLNKRPMKITSSARRVQTVFALVDRTDVVNLNAYVSGGVRTVEGSYSYIFGVGQCRALLLYADIQIRLCHLCQCVQTSLEIFFLAFQNKFEISSQWVSIKCRNEDAFWLAFGSAPRCMGAE